MEENEINVRVWLRQKFPGLADRLISPDVTSLEELSKILMIPVSAQGLKSREFRKQYAITMVSPIRDSQDGIVCERDMRWSD
ncbi:MAG: hypothetical protein ACRYFX_16950 [Janthinobacterium lividum]